MNHKFPANDIEGPYKVSLPLKLLEAPRDLNTLGLYKGPPGHRRKNPTIKPLGSVMDAFKRPIFSRVHWPFLY